MLIAKGSQIICIREEKEKTDGGIILASTAQKQNIAKVVSVGCDCRFTKEGETIFLLRPGANIEHEGVTYTIVSEKGEGYVGFSKEK